MGQHLALKFWQLFKAYSCPSTALRDLRGNSIPDDRALSRWETQGVGIRVRKASDWHSACAWHLACVKDIRLCSALGSPLVHY
jgi:hypothetical protein